MKVSVSEKKQGKKVNVRSTLPNLSRGNFWKEHLRPVEGRFGHPGRGGTLDFG